ncbi:uncharacterized protein LOC108140845 [Drosophila elegans]|uniref:uncharacterized protein LOC108140845 n=1 Tax=Drosophila elegans TaxID=30023 RepID=UPI0007E6B0B0|nr:uncharacterized protein LOC108140845 [Drosophila elegans]
MVMDVVVDVDANAKANPGTELVLRVNGNLATEGRKEQLAKMVFEVKPRNVTGFTSGVERMPEDHKGIIADQTGANSSNISIRTNTNTSHKRLNRFTQFLDLLPLGLNSSSVKLATTSSSPQSQSHSQSQSQTQTQSQSQSQPSVSVSMSPSLGSPHLSSSQLEVSAAGDSLQRSISFHSEELLLDVVTGEEFRDLQHR